MAYNIKRRSRRFPFRKRVKFGKDAPRYTGHTLNISRHGTVIEASRLYPPGTVLVIEIVDSLNVDSIDDKSIFVTGNVVWAARTIGVTQRGRMGMEFLNLPRDIELFYNNKTSDILKNQEESALEED